MKIIHPSLNMTSALLLSAAALLLWSAFPLAGYLWTDIWNGFSTSSGFPVYLFVAILTLSLVGMIALLLFFSIALAIDVFRAGWVLFKAEAGSEADWIYQLIALRGKPKHAARLSLLAAVGSYYAVLLQDSTATTFVWNLLLPILWLAAPKLETEDANVSLTTGFIVMLLLCIGKLTLFDDSTPVFYSSVFVAAALIAFPFTGVVVWWKVNGPEGRYRPLWLWRLALSLLIGGAATLIYFTPMLSAMNQLLDKGIAKPYHAEIHEKCPPGKRYYVSAMLEYEGKLSGGLIDVTPEYYDRCRAGDYMTVMVHPGYFGWPWYDRMQYQPLTDIKEKNNEPK